MDWSIQEIARLAGTTSRTLRHYGAVGLVEPSRIGRNGYRYYDEAALARLQRVLILRDLGLGLDRIRSVVEGQRDDVAALESHLEQLRGERERLDRRIRAVTTTIAKRRGGEPLMAEEMLDGFDHTQYQEEVEQRWGAEAYAEGDRWWRSLTDDDKARFQQEQRDIARAYAEAHRSGLAPDSPEVLAISRRQHVWLGVGTQGREVSKEYFTGLGEMYVADARFTKNYDAHGEGTALFVRDAMAAYAESEL